MAVSMIYDIPQKKISFKWHIMCGVWVYSYCFTKKVDPHSGVRGLKFLKFRVAKGRIPASLV